MNIEQLKETAKNKTNTGLKQINNLEFESVKKLYYIKSKNILERWIRRFI